MASLYDCLSSVLRRDVRALVREVEAFPDDASVWRELPGLPNSTGTLVLHLVGNLRHFVGFRLGGLDYTRDRPREFSARGVSRHELIAELHLAEAAVQAGLAGLTAEDFTTRFPEPVGGRTYEVGDFLLHICSHLAYHLGQADYHRRLVTGSASGVGAISLHELHTAQPVDPPPA